MKGDHCFFISMNITITSQGKSSRSSFLKKLWYSPKLTALFYSGIIATLILLGVELTNLTFWEASGLFAAGLLTWTLAEYILHRYIFHIDRYLPFLKPIHELFHGVHYNNPRDQERLFMPVLPGVAMASIVFGIFYLFAGWNAFPLMAGLTTGYLLYCYIHYLVHTRPSKLPFHKLWIHHLKHHHKYPDKAYGVSSPLWDIIFGTMPPETTNETRHFSR
jgi:sterol desaturase/sphingolipid hydroxylase (fatty acid hydroxylase superfamily)